METPILLPDVRRLSPFVACRIIVLLSILVGLIMAQGVQGQASAGRPNIVVIMADDLDVPTLQVALARNLMPHLQSHIVARAHAFGNSFVTNSLCCPSRATFLTGQYTHNHRTLTNFSPTGGITAFDDRSTIATWLQGGGYRTGYVGKYLNGYGQYVDVNRDGLINTKDRTYVPPGWNDWQALLDPGTYQMYGYRINDNGVHVSYGYASTDYQTDVLAKRAEEFIRESAAGFTDKPFFLYVSPLAPHDEIGLFTSSSRYSDVWRWRIQPAQRHAGSVSASLPLLPSFNEADVLDKPPWVQQWPLLTSTDIFYKQWKERSRLAAMRSFDDMIGVVVNALRETRRLDNTVLVFTSDNGWHFGEHRLGGKMTAYEETIRVPLFIAFPQAATSRTIDKVVLNNDLAPTFAEIGQVMPGIPVDGRSLLPLVNDPSQPWRKRFLIEHYKSIDHMMEIPTYAAIRTAVIDTETPNQLWVEYEDAARSREYYDLSIDPSQMESLHNDPSPLRGTQRAILQQRLAALKSCGGGTCQTLESD